MAPTPQPPSPPTSSNVASGLVESPAVSNITEWYLTREFRGTLNRITPRALLMIGIEHQPPPHPLPEKTSDEQTEFSRSYSLRDLTIRSLDIPLDRTPLSRFVTSLSVAKDSKEEDLIGNICSLRIKQCAACGCHKFSAEYSSPSRITRGLNEFPYSSPWSGQTILCSQSICSNCLSNAITNSIKHELFHDMDKSTWFRCPVNGCDEFLPIAHVRDMAEVLGRLGSRPKDVMAQVAMWQRATNIRQILTNIQPRLSAPALSMSAALHARLLARNVMRPFFDPSFCFPSKCTTPDEAAKVADFIPDLIEMPRIDDNGEANSLVIPFFTKLLKRKPATEARVCEGCLESWCDIDYGSLDDWIEACRPFPGSWMWTVLPFSDVLAAKCDHNINYCTNCLPEHIKANMDMYGCYAADNIRCPSEHCERKLSYKEIQCYVDKGTKKRWPPI